jgi:putative heme iron utilization protein
LEDIQAVRFVGGFARAGAISPSEYSEATPDPIAQFSSQVAQHMNEDHMESTIAIISHYIPGMVVEEAKIVSIDRLGMYIKVKRTPRASDQYQEFKLRMPFPRPAQDRADLRSLIVEMTTKATAGTKVAE